MYRENNNNSWLKIFTTTRIFSTRHYYWWQVFLFIAVLISPILTVTHTLALALPTPTPLAKSATKLALTPIHKATSVFGLIELQIDTDGVVANPFDPAQFDLRVRFTPATGKSFLIPAFWYQPFDPANLQAQGAPVWRVRFTPPTAGQWQAQAVLAQPALKSAPFPFVVAATAHNRGFVRVHPHNPHYFAFDNGDFYLPIGLNIAWSNQQGLAVLQDYTRWLDHLSENGGNLARVWMSPGAFGLEGLDTPLGDYTNRQPRAWLLDQVFQLAEQRGIYLLLCLLNHGPFSTTVNPEWETNPYNQVNGGPLKNPGDFVSNAQATALFQRRLRYIAARWAYSPNLLAWEWWNEVNWTPITDQPLANWVREMTPVLREFDPYHHLITSSYADGANTPLWQLPEIDFTQQHDYTARDPIREFKRSLESIHSLAPDKPLLEAEHGFSPDGVDLQNPFEHIHFHNSIWAAPFLGYAGTGLYWWWDSYIEALKLWPEYQHFADFMQSEDLTTLTPGLATILPGGAQALTLQSPTEALLWLRSDGYSADVAQQAHQQAILKALKSKQKLTTWQYTLRPLHGITVQLSQLSDGAYRVKWFSPQTGAWLNTTPVVVKNGTVTLNVPDFDRDLAGKLVKTP